MTAQDADDADTESGEGGDESSEGRENPGEMADDWPAGTDDDEPPEEIAALLSEIAEAPDEEVDEVLADIVAGESESAEESEREGDESIVVETTVDPADVPLSDDLLDEVENTSTDRLAKTVAVLRAQTDRLESRLEKLETQRTAAEERADDLEDRLARKQADFQNFKKRQQNLLEDEKQRATEDLVSRLLDVRDNLQRALDQDEEADIRPGVESTLEQFDQQLDRENVQRIEPSEGAETDPRRHEVLATIASDQPADTIAQVHRPGYEMGEKVLRPAQVAVSDGSLDDDEA